jgi:hypothetical protein
MHRVYSYAHGAGVYFRRGDGQGHPVPIAAMMPARRPGAIDGSCQDMSTAAGKAFLTCLFETILECSLDAVFVRPAR